MKDYSHIVARVREENPTFDAFFEDMAKRIPALQGRGAIEIRPGAFKAALKTAYLAGDDDAMERLLTSSTDDETSPSAI